MLNRLEPKALDFRWGLVNCIPHSSPSEALSAVLQGAGIASEKPKDTPPGHYVQQFRDFEDTQFVIVLDEIDVLNDPSVLTALDKVENVTTLLITLDEDEWMAELDKRVNSRVRSIMGIHLEKYHHDEMADTLRSRAEKGLRLSVTTTWSRARKRTSPTATGPI